MKIPEPPSWPVVRWINIIVALMCVTIAVASETKWIVMTDMAMAGAMLASWVWIGRIIQLGGIIGIMQDLLARQTAAIRELRGDNDREHRHA